MGACGCSTHPNSEKLKAKGDMKSLYATHSLSLSPVFFRPCLPPLSASLLPWRQDNNIIGREPPAARFPGPACSCWFTRARDHPVPPSRRVLLQDFDYISPAERDFGRVRRGLVVVQGAAETQVLVGVRLLGRLRLGIWGIS